MKIVLLVLAVVLFVLAGIAAFSAAVTLPEVGLIALGLAAFAGSFLVS